MAAEWPTYQRNAARNACDDHPAPHPPFAEPWHVWRSVRPARNNFALADQRLYVFDTPEFTKREIKAYGFELGEEAPVWEWLIGINDDDEDPEGDYMVNSPPIVSGGALYLCRWSGKVVCLELESQEVLWEQKGRGGLHFFDWDLAAGEGVVAVAGMGMDDVKLVEVLEASSGDLLWKEVFPDSRAGGAPLIHDGRLYLVCREGILHCFELRKGKRLWEKRLDAEETTPALGEGVIYVGARRDRLLALEPDTGALRWEYTASIRDEGFMHPPLHAGGRVLFSQVDPVEGEGVLHALEAASGTKLWEFRSRGKFLPAAGDEHLLFLPAVDRGIHVLEAASGQRLETLRLSPHAGPAQVALAGGNLVVMESNLLRGGECGLGLWEFSPAPSGSE